MWSNEFLDSGIYLKNMETHKGYTWILGSNWTSPVVCCDGFSWNFVTSNKLILIFHTWKFFLHNIDFFWTDLIVFIYKKKLSGLSSLKTVTIRPFVNILMDLMYVYQNIVIVIV